jgi:hypothetical protein
VELLQGASRCFSHSSSSPRRTALCRLGSCRTTISPWHAQLNADVKLFSQRVMAVRDLDDHTTACDAPVKFIEFFGFLLHSRRDRVGWWDVTKRDLYWWDHVASPSY